MLLVVIHMAIELEEVALLGYWGQQSLCKGS